MASLVRPTATFPGHHTGVFHWASMTTPMRGLLAARPRVRRLTSSTPRCEATTTAVRSTPTPAPKVSSADRIGSSPRR